MASMSGSVIGVLCRYRRFGFVISSAAAVTAPSAEPVMVRTRRAAAHVMTENDTIETSDAKAPVR